MKKSFLLSIILLCNLCLPAIIYAQMEEPELTPIEKLEQREETVETAVKALQKLKVSGYIQTQYQYAEAAADGNNFKLAAPANAYENSTINGKDLEGFSRFGIRRGRFKLTYEEGIASGVAQIDITDKGIGDGALGDRGRNVVMFKDLYINIKDPWFGTSSFKTGIFDRPFGHEIAYSSSRRESPERARIIQSLFPDERDLGAMLTLQAAKTSTWNILKLEAGLFAGNGIKPQIDSHADFIGRLSASKVIGNDMSISGGVSLYYGGVRQMNDSSYYIKGNKFVLDVNKNNTGKIAKRQYVGFDIQFSAMTVAGLTQLRGEYIFGEHPGNSSGAYSFKTVGLNNAPVFSRKISGGYVILVQDLGQTPFSAVVKYDWYNPNTEVSGDNIKVDGSLTGTGDIARSNIGLGLLWRINSALKLMAYYDIVSNETTKNIKDKATVSTANDYGYEKDRKDNVFTLRLQYKF